MQAVNEDGKVVDRTKALADTAPEIQAIDDSVADSTDTWFEECVELSNEIVAVEPSQMEANLIEAFGYIAGKNGTMHYIVNNDQGEYRFDIVYDGKSNTEHMIVHFSKDIQGEQTQSAFTVMRLKDRGWFARLLGLNKHKDLPYGDFKKPEYYRKGGVFLISDFIGLSTYQRPQDAIDTVKEANQRPDYHDLFLTQMMTLHSRIKEELQKP